MSNEKQKITIISIAGTNDERDQFNQFYFNPPLNLWGERLIYYINYILQEKIRNKEIAFNGKFRIKDFIEDCGLNYNSRKPFIKWVEIEGNLIDIAFQKSKDKTRAIISNPIFEKLEIKNGILKFKVTDTYYNPVISKSVLRYIVTTENEFKNYSKVLSFKLARWFKSRVSARQNNFPITINLNEIRILLWGTDNRNWKYYKSKKNDASTINASFINNIIKPAIKDINEYSQLKIKGPVNQEYNDEDEWDKTLKFIVSNNTDKLPKDVLEIIGATTNNLHQYLNQIGSDKITEEGILDISNKINTTSKDKWKKPMDDIPIF